MNKERRYELAQVIQEIRMEDVSHFRANYLASRLMTSFLGSTRPQWEMLVSILRDVTPKNNVIAVLRAFREFDIDLPIGYFLQPLWSLVESEDKDIRQEAAKTMASNVRTGLDYLLSKYDEVSNEDMRDSIRQTTEQALMRGVTSWQSQRVFA